MKVEQSGCSAADCISDVSLSRVLEEPLHRSPSDIDFVDDLGEPRDVAQTCSYADESRDVPVVCSYTDESRDIAHTCSYADDGGSQLLSTTDDSQYYEEDCDVSGGSACQMDTENNDVIIKDAIKHDTLGVVFNTYTKRRKVQGIL